jgi:dinuclear metal center YbgI/SA1388 family protein
MAQLADLVDWCDRYLAVSDFTDYAPNGLQVAGPESVQRVVSGVTASQALIDGAAERGADLLVVHHGFFWKGEDPRVVGMKYRRLSRLLEAGIGLLAYHLPLDAHAEVGNAVGLGRALGWQVEGPFAERNGGPLGRVGSLTEPCSGEELAASLGAVLGRPPLHIRGHDRPIRRLAWATGAAEGFIEEAADRGMDAFVSGEISEPTVHIARECGIDYFAAGHHATETFGPHALARRLAEEFDLDHEFLDVDSPA